MVSNSVALMEQMMVAKMVHEMGKQSVERREGTKVE